MARRAAVRSPMRVKGPRCARLTYVVAAVVAVAATAATFAFFARHAPKLNTRPLHLMLTTTGQAGSTPSVQEAVAELLRGPRVLTQAQSANPILASNRKLVVTLVHTDAITRAPRMTTSARTGDPRMSQ
ncbi:hypothetical protein FNF29_01461 [Cafeteria roenbergensis]|uniref:Uncharacterized protein n=1 Tax=Cafeteria roenbergensis TaxID=33653 RepID=A0A5A8CSL1_CAFRO|nr:hypothetical protein FNF29_01461 [Cafeteria roenbergensis]|eukprot:KAA0156043.1 hypothetical protein FNF29_01461 [Cafeteria roenbergensis]